MLKQDLRTSFLQRRSALSSAAYSAACYNITRHALGWLSHAPTPASVHIFLPMVNRMEYDTWPLIHFLWQQHILVYTSVSNVKLAAMQSVLLTPQTQIITDGLGIPQPSKAPMAQVTDFDIVFIPLIAVDVTGYRVGYGKGMYDRFLRDKKAKRVGISFFEPVPAITDTNSYDIPLHHCLTPKGVISF